MEPFSLLFLAVGVYLLFLMFSRTRKQQREIQRTQASLTPGAEVMTTAGLFATVVELDDQVVVLETAPGQRSRWDRRAVARVVSAAAPSPLTSESGSEPGGDEDEAGSTTPGDADGTDGPSSGPQTPPPDRA